MRPLRTAICLSLAFATAAYAHSGVRNPAVLARMEVMSGIGDEMKVIGRMAKGKTQFDIDLARAAAAEIARYAAETPGLFEAEENDPNDEARPEIWSDFEDFTAQSWELERIALGLSQSMQSKDDLDAAVSALGATCLACHRAYRE